MNRWIRRNGPDLVDLLLLIAAVVLFVLVALGYGRDARAWSGPWSGPAWTATAWKSFAVAEVTPDPEPEPSGPPLSVDFTALADGTALTSLGFSSSTGWAVADGAAHAVVTFTGANAVQDGDFESDPAGLWFGFGGGPTGVWVEDPYAGAHAFRITGDGWDKGGYHPYDDSHLPLTAGLLYRVSAWSKSLDAGSWLAFAVNTAGGGSSFGLVRADAMPLEYTDVHGTFIAPSANTWFQFYLASSKRCVVDDVTVRPISLLSALAYADYGTPVSRVTAAVHAGHGEWAGVFLAGNFSAGESVGCVIEPASSIWYASVFRAFHYVAGVWVLLFETSVTYVAGAEVEVRTDGEGAYSFWYGGTQIGADQSIPGLTGTLAGLFATGNDSGFGSYEVEP